MGQLEFVRREGLFTMLLLFIALACVCVEGEQESTIPTPSQSLHIPVLSTRFFWSQALAIAQEWQADAYVYEVSVDVPVPGRTSPGHSGYPGVKFYFQSREADYVTFVVPCNVEGCSHFEIERERPVIYCLPIELDDFTLDSGEAVDIGLEYDEKDYFNLQTASVVLMLYRDIPSCSGPVKWYISFADFATREGVALTIDAATGEVNEVRE